MIYVVKAGNGPFSPVKVGLTEAWIDQRVSGIQSCCPDKISTIVAIDEDAELEFQLHNILRPFRVSGEWFQSAEADGHDLAIWLRRLDNREWCRAIGLLGSRRWAGVEIGCACIGVRSTRHILADLDGKDPTAIVAALASCRAFCELRCNKQRRPRTARRGRFELRLTTEELQQFSRAAARQFMDVSTWLRRAGLKAAKREKEEP